MCVGGAMSGNAELHHRWTAAASKTSWQSPPIPGTSFVWMPPAHPQMPHVSEIPLSSQCQQPPQDPLLAKWPADLIKRDPVRTMGLLQCFRNWELVDGTDRHLEMQLSASVGGT